MKKVIVITGGSSGFGKQIAKRLSEKNKVIILSRTRKDLEKASRQIGCDFQVCDVTDYSQIETAIRNIVKKYKRIDCLVNDAGLYTKGLIEEDPLGEIKDNIALNTSGVIYMTRAVVPQMKKQKAGLIIMINSGAGLHYKAERSVYTATKWAITGFTKSLQAELHKYGIGVTGFYPGKMTPSMRVNGKKKATRPALKVGKVARIIEYILSFNDGTVFTEIELKHIDT